MAQQQATLDAGTPIQSLSDRPWLFRFLINLGRFFIRKPLGGFGVLIIVLFVVAALLAPLIQRYDPDQTFEIPNPRYDPEIAAEVEEDPMARLQYDPAQYNEGGIIKAQGPTWDHWFGIDPQGRDLWSRIVWGSQLSLLVGIGAAILAVSFGLFFGTISAYFGGLIDLIMQRFVDALQAFPGLILLLLIVQIVEQPNKWFITVALGIVGISQVVRIVRSAVLSAREEQYVLAARVIGAKDGRIMARHILPNIMAPTIVIFTIGIGAYILAEASLAFIGFGDPVAISWGKMVNQGRVNLIAEPWMSIFAGGAITMTVLGFNLAGDALRDVLDPRLRGAR